MGRRLVLAAAALLLVGQAFGHAKLHGSVPAADAQLESAPSSLTLRFNENVQLAALTLVTGGKSIPLNVDRNAKPALLAVVALPTLAAGIYAVLWSALSVDDGHVAKGSFTFTIKVPTAPR